MLKGIAFLLSFWSLTVPAQRMAEITYDYHPDGMLSLGRGFHAGFPLKETLNCLDYDEMRAIDSKSSVSTTYKMDFVESLTELNRELQISNDVSARLKFTDIGGDIGGSNHLENTYKFHGDSLMLMIKAESDYGRYEMDGLRLKERYRSMLQAGLHSSFESECGNHFIIRERRKGLVSALVEISHLNLDQKDELRSMLKGSLNIPMTVDQGLEFKFRDFLSKAQKSGNINFNFYALGGGGLKSLQPLVEEGLTLANITKGLGDYLKSVNGETAPPSRYYAASFNLFGLNFLEGPSPDEAVLSRLYDQITRVENVLDRVNKYLDYPNGLDQDKIEELKKLKDVYKAYRKEILSLATACMESFSCQVSEVIEEGPIQWPIITSTGIGLRNDLHCSITPFKANRYCGDRRDGWKSQLWITGQFHNYEVITEIEVYYEDDYANLKPFKQGKMDMSLFRVNEGYLKKSVLNYDASTKSSYLSFRKLRPLMYLRVSEVSGKVKWYPLNRPNLMGNHAKP